MGLPNKMPSAEMCDLVFQISRIVSFLPYFRVQFIPDPNNERNVCDTFLVSLQFVVYDLTQIYTPGGRNEPGANANQSLT